MVESAVKKKPLTYVMLTLSIMLNVSSMASIVDGFYTWGIFITNYLAVYSIFTEALFSPFKKIFNWEVPYLLRDIIVIWIGVGGVGMTLTDIFVKPQFQPLNLFEQGSGQYPKKEVYKMKLIALIFAPIILVFPILYIYAIIKKAIQKEKYKPVIMTDLSFSHFIVEMMPAILFLIPFNFLLFIDWQYLNHIK